MSIANNINEFKKKLENSECQLVAVSKTKPVIAVTEAYNAGQRIFGENKVQELVSKHEECPKDIQWHMIGHLQSNKVKYIVSFVSLIHGVDSLKLLKEINKQAAKVDRVVPCLLQVHIAREETKFGFDRLELLDLMHSEDLMEYKNVKIQGLMGMATNTNDVEQVRGEFKLLKELFEEIKQGISGENIEIKELSMGMSGDYQLALEEGSTLIRVGSAIFGERDYANN